MAIHISGLLRKIGTSIGISSVLVTVPVADSSDETTLTDATGAFDITELSFQESYDVTFQKVGFVTDIANIKGHL